MRMNKILLVALMTGFTVSAMANDVQSVEDRGIFTRIVDGFSAGMSKVRNWIDNNAGRNNTQVSMEVKKENDAKNLPQIIDDTLIDKSLKDGGWRLCSNSDIFDGLVLDKSPCRSLQGKLSPFQFKYVMLKTGEAALANPVAVHGLKGCTKEDVDRGTGQCGKHKSQMNGIVYRFVVETD